jgi:uncharacterized protein
MKAKLLHERTWALVFDQGDEAMEGLREFAEEHGVTAAHFTAIGAFSEVTLAYFDWEKKDYVEHPLDEQVEVLTLAGDVALKDGKPEVHAHVVIGRSDTSARGGHLVSGRVRPTLEVILIESPAHLRKRHDPETGLALLDLDS